MDFKQYVAKNGLPNVGQEVFVGGSSGNFILVTITAISKTGKKITVTYSHGHTAVFYNGFVEGATNKYRCDCLNFDVDGIKSRQADHNHRRRVVAKLTEVKTLYVPIASHNIEAMREYIAVVKTLLADAEAIINEK